MKILSYADGKELEKIRLVKDGQNTIVAFADAFREAESAGLDLVCVSPESKPPVCKIQDFNKIRFEAKKSEKAKKQRTSVLKEVQFKVNISDHDFGTKVARIEKFLDRGDKVKIVIRLKGRERDHPERARELLKRVVESVPCKYNTQPGPGAIAILEKEK